MLRNLNSIIAALYKAASRLTDAEQNILCQLYRKVGPDNRGAVRLEEIAREHSGCSWDDVAASAQYLERRGLLSLTWIEGAPCFLKLTRRGVCVAHSWVTSVGR